MNNASGSPRRPSRAEILNAVGRTVPDVIAPGLSILFCGINPGLYTAAIGHHFGRPGNRFWPTLYASGITPRQLSPHQERELLDFGYGITNVVQRATAKAEDLSREELILGGLELAEKVRLYAPGILAILGLTTYRTAFGVPKAVIGAQDQPLGGARVWVLPNPSGLNAHYKLANLAALYSQLREAA